jgi:hypothetical protein
MNLLLRNFLGEFVRPAVLKILSKARLLHLHPVTKDIPTARSHRVLISPESGQYAV